MSTTGGLVSRVRYLHLSDRDFNLRGGTVNQHKFAAAALLLMVGGCEAAESVDVQPLPPEDRPSAEARLGLPEIKGVWQFAGWELPPGDSAALEGVLPSLGRIDLRVQRLDSIAGIYVGNGFSAPIAGEVRRDSIVSMVTLGAAPSFVAGEVSADTLWITLSSLVPSEAWPGGKAAFVRGAAGPAFARFEGALPPPPMPVTAMSDSSAPMPETGMPEQRRSQEIQQAPPIVAEEPAPEPEPEVVAPVVTPQPDQPVLLGTPVVRDTTSNLR